VGQFIFRIDKVKNATRDSKNKEQGYKEAPELVKENSNEASVLLYPLLNMFGRMQSICCPFVLNQEILLNCQLKAS
jgi:hypothetical protein